MTRASGRASASRSSSVSLSRVAAGDQQYIGLGHDLGRGIGRPIERQLLRLQHRGVLFEHQKRLLPALQLLEERNERTDQDHPVARRGIRSHRTRRCPAAIPRRDAAAASSSGSASAFSVAIPTARRMAVLGDRLAHQLGGRARRPACRRTAPRRAENGQHTSPGTASRGVGAGAGFAGRQLDPGKEQADNRALDPDGIELGAQDVGDGGNRLVEDPALQISLRNLLQLKKRLP